MAFSCKCEIFKNTYFDEYLQIEILPEIPKFKILHVDFLFLSLLLPRLLVFFCKPRENIWKPRCSQKLSKTYKRIPVLESFLIKLQDFSPAFYFHTALQQVLNKSELKFENFQEHWHSVKRFIL